MTGKGRFNLANSRLQLQSMFANSLDMLDKNNSQTETIIFFSVYKTTKKL